MSLAAYSLAKHCASVRNQHRAFRNDEPPEYYEGPDDDEYEEAIDTEEDE